MDNIFFENWENILRVLINTVLGYGFLVLAIRISGKRTLSKMNAFDFIATIALGSCLAAVSLNKNVALAEGVAAYATLIGLQYLITFSSVRMNKIKQVVSGEPVLLVYKGRELRQVMKKERITAEEIYVAARAHGTLNIHDIDFVVLETTGDLTVISKLENEGLPADAVADLIP